MAQKPWTKKNTKKPSLLHPGEILREGIFSCARPFVRRKDQAIGVRARDRTQNSFFFFFARRRAASAAITRVAAE